MPEKVYLIDGSGYIFRAFFAVAPLSNSAGLPTNALFGFTRMLFKLLSQSDSEHMVMVFDTGRDTFRKELYPQYKANREECPEELRQQMPYFREISKTLGLQIMELPGYEADDLIGTLAKKISAGGDEVVVVSGDKDLLQLVDDKVHVWDSMRDVHYHAKEVEDKFGVPPNKVVELLGLSGDSSDNVPGLKGVGPKTAAQLVQKFGDVKTIIESAKAIREDPSIRNRNKIADQIEFDHELLRLSRQLVEIDTNAPLKLGVDSQEQSLDTLSGSDVVKLIRRSQPDPQAMAELFSRLEFSSLLKEFNFAFSPGAKAQQAPYETHVVWAVDFQNWLKRLEKQAEFAFDLETTSLDVLEAKIVGASFAWSEQEAFYVPLAHKSEQPGRQVSQEIFLQTLTPILADPRSRKYGQNLKYDCGVLAQHGLQVQGIGFDSMLGSYLLNPDKSSHNLTVLAHDFLRRSLIEFEEVTEGLADFSEVTVEKAAQYAGQDANLAWLLQRKLTPLLREHNLLDVLERLELPLIGVLSSMERKGIALDLDFLSKLSQEFSIEIASLTEKIYAAAGQEFNINSPKQLSEVLFEKLALSSKGLKRTKTGISTDSGVLEKLLPVHPIAALLLDYRALFKLKSTYVDALGSQVSTKSGRLHTSFNQTGTGTGRLSSSDPNLQNIPIQTEQGRRIRNAFVAETGKLLISADYSQIELRVLAHMSGDVNLRQAFLEGKDVHAATARDILNIGPLFEITPEQRRIGKTINFGVIYGMGGFRLARELGIPLHIANKYIEDYFDKYAGVRKLFAELEEAATRDGYVTSLLGRKRFIAHIDASGRDAGFARRAALNAPIQGSAADIVKLAMICLDRRIRSEKLPLEMLLQIHDELVFECAADQVQSMVQIVQNEMEHAIELSVPLKVDVGFGRTWREAQE